MIKPSILSELELLGKETVKKGNRTFTKSWLSGKEDKNPSVLIDVEKNSWYDFSTGEYGDSIDIEAFRKGVSRNQLIKKPIEVPREILINEDTSKFYQRILRNTQEGLNIQKDLEKRGLNKDLIEKLEIGLTYSDFVLRDILKELSKQENKYAETDILLSPVFSIKKANGKTYVNEFFRDRIIFPIKNEYNFTVGFTGRTFKNDESIKYLNTSESNIFKKKEFLYNINNALASIKKKKQVYIVEGPFDVVAYLNAGVENVISTLTCNISEQQLIKLLSLGGKDLEFIIAFDNDKAGIKGVKNCMELFKQFSIWNYKIVSYEYKDAGEYIVYQKLNDLKNVLKNPKSISEYLATFYNKSNSLSKKSSFINTFVSLVYTFPEFVSNELISSFSMLTNQSEDFIFNLLMEKKKSSEILKYILWHIKNNPSHKNMFKIMVNDVLLEKAEREVLNNLNKFDLKDYENNYKLSNLILQFIKSRSKEKLKEENPF